MAVKRIYKLWITTAERDSMTRILTGCLGQRLSNPSRRHPADLDARSVKHTDNNGEPTATRSVADGHTDRNADRDINNNADADADHSNGNHALERDRSATPHLHGREGCRLQPVLQRKRPEYSWYRDAEYDGIVCE